MLPMASKMVHSKLYWTALLAAAIPATPAPMMATFIFSKRNQVKILFAYFVLETAGWIGFSASYWPSKMYLALVPFVCSSMFIQSTCDNFSEVYLCIYYSVVLITKCIRVGLIPFSFTLFIVDFYKIKVTCVTGTPSHFSQFDSRIQNGMQRIDKFRMYPYSD